MRKLFLLPLVAISLVGCSNDQSKWTSIYDPQAIKITYGSQVKEYGFYAYTTLAYSVNDAKTVVKVKYTKPNEESEKVDTFIGNNVSIVIWA